MPSTFEFQNSHFLLHLDFRGLSTYQICCVICCVFGDCIKIEIFLFIMAPVTLIFSLHVIPCSGIDHLINLQTRTWTHINSTMPQVGIIHWHRVMLLMKQALYPQATTGTAELTTWITILCTVTIKHFSQFFS